MLINQTPILRGSKQRSKQQGARLIFNCMASRLNFHKPQSHFHPLISRPASHSGIKASLFAGILIKYPHYCWTSREKLQRVNAKEKKKKKKKRSFYQLDSQSSVFASSLAFQLWTTNKPPQWKKAQIRQACAHEAQGSKRRVATAVVKEAELSTKRGPESGLCFRGTALSAEWDNWLWMAFPKTIDRKYYLPESARPARGKCFRRSAQRRAPKLSSQQNKFWGEQGA